ncbi:phosphatase PAP2 family protein [Mycobacterium spongiae]|uniref:Phosphatase PAP2 family protein n=1 Tax=Mycobacterium spongiae TaxID=886343 RepID=A0A975JUS6_9MYCO|nr:phosphatase PAP2 family protein [Mycobacterium spongiae]QUR66046.1 phosphatase PAP2 family protein [Mycobacterium spongiae]
MTRREIILTVSFAVAACAGYATMWVGYSQEWVWLHNLDWSLLDSAHDIGSKHPVWVRFWDVVSVVMGPGLRLLGLAAAVIALAKRRVRIGLLLLACLPLSGLIGLVAKGLADRPRPASALIAEHGSSFPSGHAFEATAGVLALLTVLLPMISSEAMRVAAVAVGAFSLLMTGVARVALNVHHPSDVVAGYALGYLYFLACLWVFRPPPLFGDRPARADSSPGSAAGQPVPDANAH